MPWSQRPTAWAASPTLSPAIALAAAAVDFFVVSAASVVLVLVQVVPVGNRYPAPLHRLLKRREHLEMSHFSNMLSLDLRLHLSTRETKFYCRLQINKRRHVQGPCVLI